MSGRALNPYTHWQTLRKQVTANDTLLANGYKPSELTAAVQAKGRNIHPATAVLIAAYAKGNNNGTFKATFSGWMDPRTGGHEQGPGPGIRLYQAVVTLGNRTFADQIVANGEWGASATWRIADTWEDGADYDLVGVTEFEVADQDSLILLPTLGFTFLLVEVTALTNVTEVGFLWRPARVGEIVKTF